MGSAAATDTPLCATEQHALDTLDKILALPDLPDNLLPRAAALIPQMIALVRQTSLPVAEIAARVGKDAVLSAELMRLASSPYCRMQGDVRNLLQAITLIGLQGLQTVIAMGAEVMGNPVHAVVWLANKLAEYCVVLESGMRIMSGSFTQQFAVSRGDAVLSRFTPFGVVEVAFD